jgi:hypothetical protein
LTIHILPLRPAVAATGKSMPPPERAEWSIQPGGAADDAGPP